MGVAGSMSEQAIERAAHGEAALFEDMGVDHGCFDILVTEQFLDGADIVAILQEVGGEIPDMSLFMAM